MADKDKGKGTDAHEPPGPGVETGGLALTPPSPPTDWRTLAILLGSKVIEFGSVLHLFRGHKERFRGYAAKKRMAKFRQAPGLFRDIGQDAKGLLLLDFMADNLIMDQSTKPGRQIMCGAGLASSRDFPVRKLFLRAKDASTTVDLDATTNANTITKFTVDGIFGPKTRGILSIPLPNGRSKFELQALRPTSGLTAAFGTTMDLRRAISEGSALPCQVGRNWMVFQSLELPVCHGSSSFLKWLVRLALVKSVPWRKEASLQKEEAESR